MLSDLLKRAGDTQYEIVMRLGNDARRFTSMELDQEKTNQCNYQLGSTINPRNDKFD